MAKKAKKEMEDGSEKGAVETLERRSADGELTLEGPSKISDLVRKPCTQEAWDWLCDKVESGMRPPLRFWVKHVHFSFLADVVLKREITKAELEVLVNEDVEMVCGAPADEMHEEGHRFMGISALVIRSEEQKDEAGNYVPPIPGLSDEVSRYIARHDDGSPKRYGSVLLNPNVELLQNGHTRLKEWEKVPVCGSRFFIETDEDGLPDERINPRTHFGMLYTRLMARERNRQREAGRNTDFARVYSYTLADAEKVVDMRKANAEARREQKQIQGDKWDKRFGALPQKAGASYKPNTPRGHAKDDHRREFGRDNRW